MAGVGTVFFAVAGASSAAQAQWRDVSVAGALGALVIGGFAVVWVTFAWRLYRTALVVGERGVRIRWLLFTRTIPWSSIKEFRTWPDRTVVRLVVVLVDGRRLRTAVQRKPRLLYISMIHDGGTLLRPGPYERMLSELNALRVAAHSASPSAAAQG
jgi:Bacterial PH domain